MCIKKYSKICLLRVDNAKSNKFSHLPACATARVSQMVKPSVIVKSSYISTTYSKIVDVNQQYKNNLINSI